MIVLDTNVVSELWKAAPNANVRAWVDNQLIEIFYLSAITVAEIRFGLATMPAGRRRTTYQSRLEHKVVPAFTGRILAFDIDASKAYGELMAQARANGQAISTADGYIAATAAAHNMAVATRDTSPFEAAGLVVINPWQAAL